MRLAWITDPHLDFLAPHEVERFCAEVAAQAPDALVITGDVANARCIVDRLRRLDALLQRPVYFVLGNHDYYHGESIAATRAAVAACVRESRWLRWLTREGVVPLTPDTALVGHDGWADGRCGDYARSTVRMLDHEYIAELRRPATRLATMRALAQEAADHFRRVLPAALAQRRRVVLAIHAPPFREACWYDGQISDDNWLPHFTCLAAGEAMAAALRRQSGQLLALCGHTHGEGTAQILPNLRVLTASARYSQPAVYRVLDLDDAWEWHEPPLST